MLVKMPARRSGWREIVGKATEIDSGNCHIIHRMNFRIKAIAPLITFLFCASTVAQVDLQGMLETESAFVHAASEKGAKSAFLEFLTSDSVIFRPAPINGLEFWNARADAPDESLVRKSIYADISANGLLGYTTGNWRLYQKGKSESMADFGQYVTIWEKRQDGKFRATLDIVTTHEKLPFTETDRTWRFDRNKDLNKRGWSPADASMNFQRMSMGEGRLGGAYKRFAARDVRLLVEQEPPILGRKNVVSEMNRYLAAVFPKKVVMFQAADMAYVWNPCEYAINDEGLEKGNCLHVWKLRDKKWWIVLGVFAVIPNETPPVLRTK
jgi:ketosteroid isomerase-like protein